MTGNLQIGAEMSGTWSFGYTDYISEDLPMDVHMGTASTFVEAVAELYENVQKMACDADESSYDHFVQVLHDISVIKDDPAYSEDPDQWEDMTFHDEIGEIEYFVVED